MIMAAGRGQLEIVKLLIESGCDYAVDDIDSVRSDAACGHSGVLKYLVANGSNRCERPGR